MKGAGLVLVTFCLTLAAFSIGEVNRPSQFKATVPMYVISLPLTVLCVLMTGACVFVTRPPIKVIGLLFLLAGAGGAFLVWRHEMLIEASLQGQTILNPPTPNSDMAGYIAGALVSLLGILILGASGLRNRSVTRARLAEQE